jgi:homogentisate solanesyltransferase
MLRAALLAALLATSSALAALPALRTSPAHTPRCRVARCVQAGEALPLEAASADAAAAAATPPRSLLGQASEAADAVYRFSRPHTIRGTLLACFTGVARALIESPVYLALLPALMPRAALGVLALLLGNLFIVGINQIYDVKIDVINKPFLPIAAGRISPRAAWWLVACSGLTGLAIVKRFFNPLIFGLYAFGTTIGALYSVPPFQLKRFPLAAGLTIATCRGFLLNFGVYYATREALGLGFIWSAPVAFLARFMTVYAAVIAVTKDLGDVDGDRKGGIDTLALRFGPMAVATGASAVLALNYVGAIATAALAAPGTFRRVFMAGGHALAACWLVAITRKLRAATAPGAQPSAAEIRAYYKQIWNLFYFEYAMYPFI